MAKKNLLEPPKTREERKAAFLARQKKKKQRLMIGAGVAVLVLILAVMELQPQKASATVGVCRTFAELQLAYPQTLRLSNIEQLDRSTILYYTYTGAYGEQHSDRLECKFYLDPATHQLALESLELNRNPVDPSKLAAFNQTIPLILASKPDLTLPPRVPDWDLIDLRGD